MQPFDVILLIFTIAFGLCVGSFLNVCIFRIPREESIVTGPSHCMSCGERLKWYELIPVFSFLMQGGRCRHCKAKLSPQYPLIEAANAAGWVVCLFVKGFSIEFFLGCTLFSALLTLAVIDARTMEIPFGINVFIFILGLVRLFTDLNNWPLYLIGFAAVSGFFLLVYLITGGRGLGGGDIKLMAAAGLLLGWKNILLSLMIAAIVATVVHLIRMAIVKAGKMLAFGPYLSIGIFIAFLFGDIVINWYLSLLMA